MYKSIIKPFFDILASVFLIIISAPIVLFTSIALWLQLKEYPIFVQKRPGLNGKIFSIYKLKTMKSLLDLNGSLLPDHLRLTSLGKMVRKLSIDELPQLINILKGEMSFIGPRPLLPEYLELYNKKQIERHSVKPGITGWAQVNGRNTISWTEKFKLDVWYANHLSLSLDLKIIYLTIVGVFSAKGINASREISMEPFNGKN